MTYTPKHFRLPKGGVLPGNAAEKVEPYVFTDAIAIAVDVALATQRPLLVSGNPGCGKSRLADAVAAAQGWGLLARTVTSRTRLETLTADVDQLRRLNDAQAHDGKGALKPDGCYLNPGILWWAFDAQGAARRGLAPNIATEHKVCVDYPGTRRDAPRGQKPGTVLLLDEIDKAEPDLPNDLLEPLDRRRFDLPEGFAAHHPDGARTRVEAPPPAALHLLTIITTNGERDLPQAFLRRCVLLEIDDPDEDALVDIARKHFPQGDATRMRALAKLLLGFRDKADELRVRPPGTAELLDAVQACEELGVFVSAEPNSVWSHLERAILAKDRSLWP
jgi:MoxR-like ATPase